MCKFYTRAVLAASIVYVLLFHCAVYNVYWRLRLADDFIDFKHLSSGAKPVYCPRYFSRELLKYYI